MSYKIYKTPNNQKIISLEDLNKFSIDDKNQLYCNGQRIKSEVTLSKFQNYLAFLIAFFVLISIISTILISFLDLNSEFCWIKATRSCWVDTQNPNE